MNVTRRSFLQMVSTTAMAAAVSVSDLAAAVAAKRGFEIRGLELCSSGIWQWQVIDQALELMGRFGMNALILGQDTLPNWIVWPRAYFSEDFMYARDPTHMTVSHTGADFLRQVIRRAGRGGIRVFLETKEISYPYLLVERHPELMEIKGIVCPTHPLWWQFERARYQEIVDTLPGLGGVVVSAGTSASQVAFAARRCPCERCRYYSPATWHENLIRSLYEPVRGNGRLLVVRDASHSRPEQDAIIEGCRRVSPEVVLSLRTTPGDFCPVFPDNPRIGDTAGNEAWVEYDAMGQYSGQGAFPVSLVGDIRRRLRHALASGARGAWFRADVPSVSDVAAFNSPNLLNVCAGALLAAGMDTRPGAILERYFAWGVADPLKTESEEGAPVPLSGDNAARFARFMEASWDVMAKTTYVRGLPFTDGGGRIADSLAAAADYLVARHGLDDWVPGAARRVAPTVENLRLILAEKDEAERGAAALPGTLGLHEPGFPAGLRESFGTMLRLYALYVRGFRCAAAGCFRAQIALTTRAPADLAAARTAARELDAYAAAAATELGSAEHPHFICRLLDPGRPKRLAADIREKTAEAAWENTQAE